MGEPELHSQFLERPSYRLLQTDGLDSEGELLLYDHDVFGIRVVSKTVSLLGLKGGIARSEPRLLLKLKHDRIVRIREAQWAPGYDEALKVVNFTTDYCEGKSVFTALEDAHTFSVNDALRIGRDVLDALACVHEDHTLLHRDVKPGNVMLDAARRRGFLGDFGSAALLEDGRAAVGGQTLPYQDPSARTNGFLSTGADVYGVGMVMLEMLNGPLPIDDLDYDRLEKRVGEGRRSMPDSYFVLAPWVPPKAATIVRAMCAREPEQRPKSAAAVIQRIGNAACVDWRRLEGDGLAGAWRGAWPPHVPLTRARTYEVRADPITSGRYKGLVRLRGSWRSPGAKWRAYAKLETRVAAGDSSALAKFFRAVETEAKAAPVR